MSGNDPAAVLPYRDPEVLPEETLGRRQDGATSGRERGAGKQTPTSGALSSIRGRVAGRLSSLLTTGRVVIIIPLLISLVAVWRQDAVIDTISVPKDLEADGYTPATMSQRIMDAVTQINRDVTLTKRLGMFRLSELDPLHPESADYESPGRGHSWDSEPAFTLTSDNLSKKYDISVGGVSLTPVILYLRELAGMSDTRISGEITVEQPPPSKKFSIRLRISGRGHVQYEAEATDKLETLVEQAALKCRAARTARCRLLQLPQARLRQRIAHCPCIPRRPDEKREAVGIELARIDRALAEPFRRRSRGERLR